MSFRKYLIFLAFVIFTLILLFPEGHTTLGREYRVEEVSTPGRLQSLIDPTKNEVPPTWLGADVATSIKVNGSYYVWLFGDTILGSLQGGNRDYSVFIHNTVGVARRNKKEEFGDIDKYYRKSDGQILPIFSLDKPGTFYWPLVGTMLDSSLLVAADRVATKESGSFKILGTGLFTVTNPLSPPNRWNYEVNYIPKKNKITWGSAIVKQKDFVYIFGQRGTGVGSRTVLARLRVSDVKDADPASWEYWGKEGWSAKQNPSSIPGLPGISETTIQRNSFLGWYSLQIPPLSYDVHLYTANKITGPWKDQGVVYEIPAPWDNSKTDEGKPIFIAYAAKSHPELADSDNQIVFTYNVNLDPFVSGLTDKLGEYLKKEEYEGLYVPQFVSIKLAKSS